MNSRKERHRRAPSRAALTDLVALLLQFEDAIDGFERPSLGNDALLYEQVVSHNIKLAWPSGSGHIVPFSSLKAKVICTPDFHATK
jgi:hypothetical protein